MVSFHFLSPYSPFLNPCENAANMIKQAIKVPHERGQLHLAVQQAVHRITPQTCQAFIHHSHKFLQPCKDMKELQRFPEAHELDAWCSYVDKHEMLNRTFHPKTPYPGDPNPSLGALPG